MMRYKVGISKDYALFGKLFCFFKKLVSIRAKDLLEITYLLGKDWGKVAYVVPSLDCCCMLKAMCLYVGLRVHLTLLRPHFIGAYWVVVAKSVCLCMWPFFFCLCNSNFACL